VPSRATTSVTVVASAVTPREDDVLVDARRRGLRRRLTDGGMNIAMADRWIEAWGREATRRALDPRSPDYWRAGANWIGERTRKR
jgi:hypothetical protein